MSEMKIIDADAHIVESQALWDGLEGRDKRFRPATLSETDGDGQSRDFWLVDGVLRRLMPAYSRIPPAIRDLTDVAGRLAVMDELGVDVQVIYPTYFLAPVAYRTEVLVALCRSYNRFLADASDRSGGRLRWVVAPPLDSMADSLAELEFGKQHGACGVFIRGLEGERILSDPYFHPLYDKAAALDLPLCIHVGNGNMFVFDKFKSSALFASRSPVLAAFQDLLLGGIPDRFPALRFGFIEAGAQWVPYVISEVTRRAEWISKGGPLAAFIANEMGGNTKEASRQAREKDAQGLNIVRDSRFYVGCRLTDDLEYVQRWAGKKNLVTGTDYGHDDYSEDLEAFSNLRGMPGADVEAIDGIRGNNARALYGI